jgi:hypothetical protein
MTATAAKCLIIQIIHTYTIEVFYYIWYSNVKSRPVQNALVQANVLYTANQHNEIYYSYFLVHYTANKYKETSELGGKEFWQLAY